MANPVSSMSALMREAVSAAKATSSAGSIAARADDSNQQAGRSLGSDAISERFEEKTRAILNRMDNLPGAGGSIRSSGSAAIGLPAPSTPAPAAGDMLSRVLGEVDAPLRAAENLPVDVLQGRVTSPAEIAATIKRADLTFKYSLEIRNRLLDAYREVMRMGV